MLWLRPWSLRVAGFSVLLHSSDASEGNPENVEADCTGFLNQARILQMSSHRVEVFDSMRDSCSRCCYF